LTPEKKKVNLEYTGESIQIVH